MKCSPSFKFYSKFYFMCETCFALKAASIARKKKNNQTNVFLLPCVLENKVRNFVS